MLLLNHVALILIKTNRRRIRSDVRHAMEHMWTARSLLHDTRTVNLALVQCECLTGKQLSLQELNQLIEIERLT